MDKKTPSCLVGITDEKNELMKFHEFYRYLIIFLTVILLIDVMMTAVNGVMGVLFWIRFVGGLFGMGVIYHLYRSSEWLYLFQAGQMAALILHLAYITNEFLLYRNSIQLEEVHAFISVPIVGYLSGFVMIGPFIHYFVSAIVLLLVSSANLYAIYLNVKKKLFR